MGFRAIGDLLRNERKARVFFAAHAQSSLGTGAAYVGLLVLAFERLDSPWAISLVLLADFLPAMLLGPLFGAAADRWSRRWCAAAADVARALAFVSLAFFDGFGVTVGLALLAGVGTGLFNPSVMAGMPGLVAPARLPAATALYGALADLGFTLGPALAGLGLLFVSAESMMLVNGLSFAVSAVALTFVPLGGGDRRAQQRSLVREAQTGVRTVMQMAGVRSILFGSSAVILFAGLFNVGELLLAQQELGAGESGFAALVALFGLGVAAGSLAGSGSLDPLRLKRRYLAGMAVTGIGFLAAAVAPTFVVAAVGFAVAGAGNGLVVVHQRLLLQITVDEHMLGRVFGFKETLGAWAYTGAFVSAGLLLGLGSTRAVLGLAGAGVVVVAAASTWLLRGHWNQAMVPQAEATGQHLPELVERLDSLRPATPAGARV